MALTKFQEHVLEFGIRKKIYDYISSTPGCHFRDIQRKLNLSVGVLDYHLHYMEKCGVIASRSEGRYKRYYVAETLAEDRRIMSALRIGAQRRILMFLLMKPDSGLKSISDSTGILPSAVSFHLKHLLSSLIIRRGRNGYFVSEPDSVIRLLIKYRPSFFDSAVDRFVDVWIGMEGKS